MNCSQHASGAIVGFGRITRTRCGRARLIRMSRARTGPIDKGRSGDCPRALPACAATTDSRSSSWLFGVARTEVVIENDIGWRIDTMVDFLFGKPISISSLCSDPQRRSQIETLLSEIIEQNGGLMLLQQIATLGAVYGFVDVLVKLNPSGSEPVEPAMDGARPSRETTKTSPPRLRQSPRRDLTIHPARHRMRVSFPRRMRNWRASPG